MRWPCTLLFQAKLFVVGIFTDGTSAVGGAKEQSVMEDWGDGDRWRNRSPSWSAQGRFDYSEMWVIVSIAALFGIVAILLVLPICFHRYCRENCGGPCEDYCDIFDKFLSIYTGWTPPPPTTHDARVLTNRSPKWHDYEAEDIEVGCHFDRNNERCEFLTPVDLEANRRSVTIYRPPTPKKNRRPSEV